MAVHNFQNLVMLSSPLHSLSVRSAFKDLHRKASKDDKMCAAFINHLSLGD